MIFQKLLRIFERVDPFWLIFLDKDLWGQISADGLLYNSNFSATYLESVSSSGSLYAGNGSKGPKDKGQARSHLDGCLPEPTYQQ